MFKSLPTINTLPTLAHTTADTTTLKDHINNHIENYNEKPETLTADASYGSEENYQDLEAKERTARQKERKNQSIPSRRVIL